MNALARAVVPLVMAAAVLSGCSTSPTGRSQLLLLPASEADKMGAQAFDQLKDETPLSTDRGDIAYVECISNALIAELDEPLRSQEWEIRVFASDDLNAFALPGRKIGVYTGMVEFADNADQLGAVIGHEIGHVMASHSAERVSQNMVASTAMQVLSASGQVGSAGMQALGLGAQYGVLLPFSRAHESEADEIGLDLVADAGFDPRGAPGLWQKMSANRGGGGGGPEFMSTHPADSTRIAKLTAQLKDVQPRYQRARAAGKRPNCRR